MTADASLPSFDCDLHTKTDFSCGTDVQFASSWDVPFGLGDDRQRVEDSEESRGSDSSPRSWRVKQCCRISPCVIRGVAGED